MGYSFKFGNECFSLLKNSQFIGSGFLCDGLYKFKLDNLFVETLLAVYHNVGTKHNMTNESSISMWHKHLGHISKEMLERLLKNEILLSLDLLILGFVWIALRESKPNKPTRET